MNKFLVAALVALVGCGGPDAPEITPLVGDPPDIVTPKPGVARYSLTVSQDRQSAPIGSDIRVAAAVMQDVPNALRSTDGKVLVNFVVVKGGGSVFAGSALVEGEGSAKEIWTLGNEMGTQALEVRAIDQTTGEPIVFERIEADATKGPPAYFTLTTNKWVTPLHEAFNYNDLWLTAFDVNDNKVPMEEEYPLHLVKVEAIGTVLGDIFPPTCETQENEIRCPISNTLYDYVKQDYIYPTPDTGYNVRYFLTFEIGNTGKTAEVVLIFGQLTPGWSDPRI